MTTAPYSIQYYQNLLTSEYISDQDTLDTICLSVQPFSDTISLLQNLYESFELNNAVGDQLTRLGYLVGVSRYVNVPLTGVYFSLDSATLGLDQGSMQGPYDPTSGLTALPDDIYLSIIQATILLNTWDGSIPGLYKALNPLLEGLVIWDSGTREMFYGLTTTQTIPILTEMFLQGYFSLAPAGVSVLPPVITTPNGTPFFGLDAETVSVSGLDTGYMI